MSPTDDELEQWRRPANAADKATYLARLQRALSSPHARVRAAAIENVSLLMKDLEAWVHDPVGGDVQDSMWRLAWTVLDKVGMITARIDDEAPAVRELSVPLVLRLVRIAEGRAAWLGDPAPYSFGAFNAAPFLQAVPGLVRIVLSASSIAAVAAAALASIDASIDLSSAEATYRSALAHVRADVRIAAIQASAETGATAPLIEGLDDPASEVRIVCARLLGALRVVAAAESLGGCLTDPDPAVRLAAAVALPAIATKVCVPYLTEALGDPALAVYAAEALRRCRDE